MSQCVLLLVLQLPDLGGRVRYLLVKGAPAVVFVSLPCALEEDTRIGAATGATAHCTFGLLTLWWG